MLCVKSLLELSGMHTNHFNLLNYSYLLHNRLNGFSSIKSPSAKHIFILQWHQLNTNREDRNLFNYSCKVLWIILKRWIYCVPSNPSLVHYFRNRHLTTFS